MLGLADNILVARNAERVIGIYPEIKTPEFYKQEIPDFDFSLELAKALTKDSRFQISANFITDNGHFDRQN